MKKLVVFGLSMKPRGLQRKLVGWRVERALVKQAQAVQKNKDGKDPTDQ